MVPWKACALSDKRAVVVSSARGRFGRGASTYLALFLLAVAAAPHQHLNDLEDLLLDQRSDSGVVAQTVGMARISENPTIQPVHVVQDIPCPACFTSDF